MLDLFPGIVKQRKNTNATKPSTSIWAGWTTTKLLVTEATGVATCFSLVRDHGTTSTVRGDGFTYSMLDDDISYTVEVASNPQPTSLASYTRPDAAQDPRGERYYLTRLQYGLTKLPANRDRVYYRQHLDLWPDQVPIQQCWGFEYGGGYYEILHEPWFVETVSVSSTRFDDHLLPVVVPLPRPTGGNGLGSTTGTPSSPSSTSNQEVQPPQPQTGFVPQTLPQETQRPAGPGSGASPSQAEGQNSPARPGAAPGPRPPPQPQAGFTPQTLPQETQRPAGPGSGASASQAEGQNPPSRPGAAPGDNPSVVQGGGVVTSDGASKEVGICLVISALLAAVSL